MIFHLFAGMSRPNGTIDLKFGMRGDIADIITVTYAKYCENRFRGFRFMIPPIFSFSIGLADRPYNTAFITRRTERYVETQSHAEYRHCGI